MDIAIQVALIGALFTFFAGVLTHVVNSYREQFEKEKWNRTIALEEQKWARTIALEEQRFEHEKNRWALELTNLREMELLKHRFEEYPEVFKELGALSSYKLRDLTHENALALADKLNEFGYGKAGLSMLPDTRQAILILRNSLKALVPGQNLETILHPRTDALEFMRRDLSHNRSIWRHYESLLDINRKQVQLDQQVPGDLGHNREPHNN